jgi:cold shock CspA family protein
MNGTIKWFDGNKGRIIGDNGAEYFFHWTDITGGAKHRAAAKRPVRFDAEEAEKGPRARNIEVIRFEAPHGDTGSWSDFKGLFKCSECFSTTEHPFKFCPHCGAKMRRESEAGK